MGFSQRRSSKRGAKLITSPEPIPAITRPAMKMEKSAWM